MNGSDVWGSSAPYGDILPVFKWNIYKRMITFPSKMMTVITFTVIIIDDSLQNTLGEKKMPSVIWKLLISLPTGTAIILSFMKLLIFLINIHLNNGRTSP